MGDTTTVTTVIVTTVIVITIAIADGEKGGRDMNNVFYIVGVVVVVLFVAGYFGLR
jgi:RsiW-degrading membrane proteinase PrsW (M82 family)